MRRDLPTGTVTFLFTDVEGSTKLLHELGDERYEEELSQHRSLLREAFSSHGGIEVYTQGDAFFFAFPTVEGALAGAENGGQALASGPVRARMGLHTGTPHVGNEGYVGRDVHLAARIAASGHGGQVVLSKATRDLAGDAFADLGEHRLKDFDRPGATPTALPSSSAPLRRSASSSRSASTTHWSRTSTSGPSPRRRRR